MTPVPAKPYHHGDLRQAVVDAAVAEVIAVGASAVSMREIARRAGVSHAAPAHHFGDKAGVFTAVATEGFGLAAKSIGAEAVGRFGFLTGGSAYIAFALTHPGHFEVMFHPDLYRGDDPALVAAREAAFDVLHGSARELVSAGADDDITGLVLAGWSFSHGFATLALSGNLDGRLGPTPDDVGNRMFEGLVTLGTQAEKYLRAQARQR